MLFPPLSCSLLLQRSSNSENDAATTIVTTDATAAKGKNRSERLQQLFLFLFFFSFFSRRLITSSLLPAPPPPHTNKHQSTDLTNGATVKSWLPKANLTVDLSQAGVVAVKTDSGAVAKVTEANVPAGAAVVHLVDAVLVPTPEAIKEAPARVAAWKAKKAASPSAAPRRLAERI